MYDEDDKINYDFDYDDEKKDVRRTVGKICICIGILLILFVTNLFVKDMRYVVKGTKISATLEKREERYVAKYTENGNSSVYDLGGYMNRFHRKTVSVYYLESPSDGVFINWGMYIISYGVYFFIFFYGIISFKNMGLIEFFKRLFSKKRAL